MSNDDGKLSMSVNFDAKSFLADLGLFAKKVANGVKPSDVFDATEKDVTKQAFDAFSGNDDTITTKELKKAFVKLGMKLNKEQLLHLAKEYDKDHKGGLKAKYGFEEFSQMLTSPMFAYDPNVVRQFRSRATHA